MKLLDLAGERRWCAWREVPRYKGAEVIGRTKEPFYTRERRFASTRSETWIPLAEAQALAQVFAAEQPEGWLSGVGIASGSLGNGFCIGGIDYDACIGVELADWAGEGLDIAHRGHVETSPSGQGVRQFLLFSETEIPAIREALRLGAQNGSHLFRLKGDGAKKPGLEIYWADHYLTTTGALWEGDEISVFGAAEAKELRKLVERVEPRKIPTADDRPLVPWQADDSNIAARMADLAARRQRFAALLAYDHIGGRINDPTDRSAFAGTLCAEMRAEGWSVPDMEQALLLSSAEVVEWMHEKGLQKGKREFLRAATGIDPSTGLKSGVAISRDAIASAAMGPIESVTLEGEIIGEHAAADWRKMLQMTKSKEWIANINNVRLFLLEDDALKNMLAFNEFANQIMLKRHPPYERGANWIEREWRDSDQVRLAAWLQAEGLKTVSPDTVADAVLSVALDNKYDPVREYLEYVEQRWDRLPRINTWLHDYLGAAEEPYVMAVAAKSLIGSVARVMQPGCKLDTITVLEGAQGIYKSTTLRVLYGDEYFVDHMPDIHTKDAPIQLAGRWGVEYAEMDKVHKGEASRVKAFLSTPVDIYRPPYGRFAVPVPRRCAAWATVNDAGRGYLQDETGNRRWWPIKCADKKVDLQKLQSVRDQLWGEATHRWRAGEHWWMNGEADRKQVEEVGLRFEEDVWTDKIKAYVGGKIEITVSDILEKGLFKPKERWTQSDQNRIARTLKSEGWIRYQFRDGDFREWRYKKP